MSSPARIAGRCARRWSHRFFLHQNRPSSKLHCLLETLKALNAVLPFGSRKSGFLDCPAVGTWNTLTDYSVVDFPLGALEFRPPLMVFQQRATRRPTPGFRDLEVYGATQPAGWVQTASQRETGAITLLLWRNPAAAPICAGLSPTSVLPKILSHAPAPPAGLVGVCRADCRCRPAHSFGGW